MLSGKILALLLFLGLVVLVGPSIAQDTLSVLFLGNSYTQFNDLPQLFLDLSASGGFPVFTDSYTPGGYTLEGHSTDETSLRKIERGDWDYVILQEQSQIPTIDYLRYNMMYPAARILDSLIANSGSNTGFFMTWGRKYGGQQTWGSYSSPVFEDFFHMQDSLSSAYTEIAQELDALLSPVGNAWATAVEMDSLVDLWQLDNSHPTLSGSYLAACVFYSVFYGLSPVGLTYTAGLSEEDALFLQTAAELTVLSAKSNISNMPSSFKLYQNYPNPFNSSTVYRFSIPHRQSVEASIYNITGQKTVTLFDGIIDTGNYSLNWDASGMTNGVYIMRLTVGSEAFTVVSVLVK